MEGLQAEKRKRERDLDLLRISEPKLQKELASLKETMEGMQRDMQNFQDIEGNTDMDIFLIYLYHTLYSIHSLQKNKPLVMYLIYYVFLMFLI